jgi:hypothetical protein
LAQLKKSVNGRFALSHLSQANFSRLVVLFGEKLRVGESGISMEMFQERADVHET